MEDLNNLIELRKTAQGTYFFGDTTTGIIYESPVSLSELKKKHGGIGALPLAIITAVGAVAPKVMELFGQKKAAEQQGALLQQQMLIEQQRAQSQQQMMIMAGGIGLLGLASYFALK